MKRSLERVGLRVGQVQRGSAAFGEEIAVISSRLHQERKRCSVVSKESLLISTQQSRGRSGPARQGHSGLERSGEGGKHADSRA